MFKPNRVGTPVIHTITGVDNNAAFTLQLNGNSVMAQPFNVINAAPVLDFGRSQINWTAAARVQTNSNKSAFVQQFTVTQPVAGDTVGVELNGSLFITAPNDIIIQPAIMRIPAQGAIWAGTTANDVPTPIAPPVEILDNVAARTNTIRAAQYQSKVIIQDAAVGGSYAHGFIIYNAGVDFNITGLKMIASVRQLNDQQGIGYRDTLR